MDGLEQHPTAADREASVDQAPRLCVDATMVVDPADRMLVTEVVEVLDSVDHDCVQRAHLGGVAMYWTPGVTAAVRLLLAGHRPDPDGACAGCPVEVRPVPAWPCPWWRRVHYWMVVMDPVSGRRREDDWDYYVS